MSEWLKKNPDRTAEDVLKLSPNELIDQAWDGIFSFDFPVWSSTTKESVSSAILRNYFMREIAYETPAYWKLKLHSKMEQIMPYWAEMGNIQDGIGDIYDGGSEKEVISRNATEESNRDVTKGNERTGSQTRGATGSDNVTDTYGENHHSSGNSTNTRTGKNLFSDTPQNGLQQVEEGKYLTNATIENGTGSEEASTDERIDRTNSRSGRTQADENLDSSITDKGNENEFANAERNENVSRETLRKVGGRVDQAAKAKETFVNCIQGVVRDVADLFMLIY